MVLTFNSFFLQSKLYIWVCQETSEEPVNGRLEFCETYRKKHPGNKFKNPRTAHRSIFSTCMARCDSQDPFSELKISNSTFLDQLEKRANCQNCGKSRKFFCYSCYIPVSEIKDLVPHIPVRCIGCHPWI